MHPSTRAQIVTRRTYCRPKNDEGTVFESWEEVIDRVITHQRWLWERALTHQTMPEMPLNDVTEGLNEWLFLTDEQEDELEALRVLMLDRKVAPAGRCFTGDTKVKLLDGTTPRFDELEVGKTYWAYGSTMEGRVVPVEAINNGITRTDNKYAKVTLDNDEVIKCTIDHPFLTREGIYVEAKDLEVGQSLMPLYTRLNRHGYEEVKDNSTGQWITTHKLVAQDQNLDIPEFDKNQFLVLHHRDFNKFNNTPSNLEYMGDQDHFNLHSKLGKENAKKLNDLIWYHPDYEEFRKAKAIQCREMALDFWNNPKYEKSREVVKQKSSERAVERNQTEKQKEALKVFRASEEGVKISLSNLRRANEGHYGLKVKLFKMAKSLFDKGLEINEVNWTANKPFKGAMGIGNIEKYFGSFDNFYVELSKYNHSVKSVEIIESDQSMDFYDFSVPRTVNFALASGVFVHNTLWLGGTEIGKRIELSQFNCCFVSVRTVYDIVDFFWGLLNGAGVTGLAEAGTLTGFRQKISELEIIRTKRSSSDKGPEENSESWNPHSQTWVIKVGDSAKAWAKSIGKLIAGKYPAKKLILDFSQIRGGGARLRNYGWVSQGDTGLSKAYAEIFNILNAKADCLLTEIDIGDIINLLGTVLSTRRAAEALLMHKENPRWKEFARVKQGMWENGKEHRAQSNNSILFYNKPTYKELTELFEMINAGGNGEPGFVNAKHMKDRAPWAQGLNPCFEILLADGNTCNLVTIDLAKFKNDTSGLLEAARLITRANYRQTVVDFRDGILQEKWHLNNEHLHLCGVSLMGIAMRPDMQPYDYKRLERVIVHAGYGMAEELGTPYPKNLTAQKPEGTISKCYDSTEGMHTPLGKYIFNNIAFSMYDPLVKILAESGYKTMIHPYDSTAMLVTMPVKYDDVEFEIVDDKPVNQESAVKQLERYKMLMQHYCHQNVSCTISYSTSETKEIVDWLFNNWDSYVAVSFLFRNDPTKTAADLGYPYLPQEVVTQEVWEDYVSGLKEFDLDQYNSSEELQDDGCAQGVCPIR